VSVGTVTAQLLYEIEKPAYINPDVVAHFETIRLEQAGPDRVRVSGCQGSPPPATAKVCINTLKGHRNAMGVRLTGLDIEEKAKIVEQTIFTGLGGKDRFDEVSVELLRTDHEDPDSNDKALATLRIAVVSQGPKLAGRLFSAKVVEIALANIPGFTLTQPPGDGAPNVVYRPALVSKREVHETVHLGGAAWEIPSVLPDAGARPDTAHAAAMPPAADPPSGKRRRMPLGRIAGTRSGDKGGNANLGVWAQSPEGFAFLREFLTVERLKALLPDVASYAVERHELPNLNALNFYIHGILGEGGTSSTRTDAQAKTLGEYLRAKVVDVPEALVSR